MQTKVRIVFFPSVLHWHNIFFVVNVLDKYERDIFYMFSVGYVSLKNFLCDKLRLYNDIF